MSEIEVRKVKVVLPTWKSTIKFSNAIEHILSFKMRWMMYTTSTEDNRDIQFSSKEFRQTGELIRADGSTSDYFYSAPLDLQSEVTCINSNFTQEKDIVFRPSLRSLNSFELEIFINDTPATVITEENPITIEFAFYTQK